MDYGKIIFFRNFFVRAFIIGVVFALFYFIVTYAFWDTWASWATHVFKTDEKELRERTWKSGFDVFCRVAPGSCISVSCASSGLPLDG